MKNLLKGTLLATTLFMGSSAMAQQAISLPRPNMKAKSLTVTEALSTRHSVRQFDTTPLTLQQLSDLCWAACGVSRNNDYRTAPSAMNKKEIRLFVFTEKGVYEYDAVANSLTQKADGDHRELITGSANGYKQAFAKEAPVTLFMVIDFNGTLKKFSYTASMNSGYLSAEDPNVEARLQAYQDYNKDKDRLEKELKNLKAELVKL